jgi:hypothetical protein
MPKIFKYLPNVNRNLLIVIGKLFHKTKQDQFLQTSFKSFREILD